MIPAPTTRIADEDDMVLLSIIDDGVGFDLAEWDRAPGSESSYGLRFMRTRMRELGGSLDLTDAQWVNSLYAVLLAALLLSTGSLADRRGRRRLFLAGLVVFMLGSVLAAAAGNAGLLIGARAVQAVGAAFIMPSTLSTVNAVFRALGLVGTLRLRWHAR